MSDLNKKVQWAIKLLKLAEESAVAKSIERERERERENESTSYSHKVEICYSTGKDSDVILHLARLAGIDHIPIYKTTTIDQPHSIQHAKNNGAVIIRPKKTFFELIELYGFPCRFYRFCCTKLKEYKINDVAVQGIRTAESRKRAQRYKEPQICRMYGRKERVSVFLPILSWTDEDVEEFVKQENIQCHPHYYDDDGRFHVERRVGCLCCPLMSRKNRIEKFKEYPKMVRAYIKHGRVFMEKRPDIKSNKYFNSIEDKFFFDVFCDSMEDFKMKTDGLFGRLDCRKFLEDYFKTDLP